MYFLIETNSEHASKHELIKKMILGKMIRKIYDIIRSIFLPCKIRLSGLDRNMEYAIVIQLPKLHNAAVA